MKSVILLAILLASATAEFTPSCTTTWTTPNTFFAAVCYKQPDGQQASAIYLNDSIGYDQSKSQLVWAKATGTP
jgi:hypothetical protein